MRERPNKRIRFMPELVPLVLSGEKSSTWRIDDDKDLTPEDILDFIETGSDRHFATARVCAVIEKLMGDVTDEDFETHEKFPSHQAMYQTYSQYYQKSVGPDTPLKIINFELI
jgi:hypothetical protein